MPRLVAEAAAHPEHLATMTWDELRALAERGVEIGSHTITHPHLPDLTDGELERELAESRELIEAELDRPCRYIAYPYGEHDPRVRTAVSAAGYEAAFALGDGAQLGDRFALPRIDLYRNDHLLRATLKTSFIKPVGSRLLKLVNRNAEP